MPAAAIKSDTQRKAGPVSFPGLPVNRTGLKNERGVSMIEMALVIAIMGLVIGAVLRFTVQSKTNLIEFENKSELIRYTERISENLRASVKASAMLLLDYDNTTSTITTNYTSLLDNSVAASPDAPEKVAFSRLPLAKTSDQMVATTPSAKPYFGNELQFVANVPGLRVYYDATNTGAYLDLDLVPAGASVEEMEIERVQFVDIYMGNMPGKKAGAVAAPRLGLVEWRSVPLVKLSSVDWLASPKKEAVLDLLAEQGYDLAWEAGEADADRAFYEISDGSSYLSALNTAPAALARRSWAYMHQFLRVQDYRPSPLPISRVASAATGAGVSGFSTAYSLAYNTGGSPAGLSVNKLFAHGQEIQVPRFALADAGGFPGGFEVLVSGSQGRRKVYAYLTMMAVSAANKGALAYNASHSLTLATVSNPL